MNFLPGDRIHMRHQIGRYTVVRQTGKNVIYRCQTWLDDHTDQISAIDCKKVGDADFPFPWDRASARSNGRCPNRLDDLEITGEQVERFPALKLDRAVASHAGSAMWTLNSK